MRPSPIRPIHAALAALMLGLVPPPAGAEAPQLVTSTLAPADPCAFYRSQAYGKGLMHFATEMLWACEVIAERRGAGMRVGDRLEAVAAALEEYRAGVLAQGQARFSASRATAPFPAVHGLDEPTKHELARRTGALAALDAVRNGF